MQQKTKTAVQFEITQQSRDAIEKISTNQMASTDYRLSVPEQECGNAAPFGYQKYKGSTATFRAPEIGEYGKISWD